MERWLDNLLTSEINIIHKEASAWESLSYEAQKAYLKAHPKSKKKITAKPGQGGKSLDDLKNKLQQQKKNVEPDTKDLKSFKFTKNALKVVKEITDGAKEQFEEWGGKFSSDDIDSFVNDAFDAVEIPEEENDDFENLQSELRDLIESKIRNNLKGMIKDTTLYDTVNLDDLEIELNQLAPKGYEIEVGNKTSKNIEIQVDTRKDLIPGSISRENNKIKVVMLMHRDLEKELEEAFKSLRTL